MEKVVKRNGEIADFDDSKIKNAVMKACEEVYPGDINNSDIAELAREKVNSRLSGFGKDVTSISVEDIQDIVEQVLMSMDGALAKSYITYRYKRNLVRNEYKELMDGIRQKLSTENVQNQNANVDEYSFGGRIGEATDIMMKRYALEYCMSDLSRNNHINNEIYIHDLSHYAIGDHNCLTLPLDELLSNGFNTRQTDVRPAQSVNTAFQLVAVLFQLQSLQQFGGVAASHLDWTMVPYVRKSFYKHWNDGCKYILRINPSQFSGRFSGCTPIEEYKSSPGVAYNYAMDMTTKEVYQAVEGMFHNLKIWA